MTAPAAMPAPAPVPSAPAASLLPEPFPYQRRIVEYLKAEERGLWEWLTSAKLRAEQAGAARLELLKTTYRLEPEKHPDLHALVAEVGAALGVAAPATVYQAEGAGGPNASLFHLPGEVHLVLAGPLLATLSGDELRAVIAHEVAHFALFEGFDGEMRAADQALAALAALPRAEPAHVASARLHRLYVELYCDRAALPVVKDPLVAVAALIKTTTGLRDASAESYLRQAAEILDRAEVRTEGVSHPESFIRARALELFAARGPAADAEIARLVEGSPVLDELDLLAQQRLTRLTRRIVERLLAPAWMRTPALLGHARHFFADLEPGAAPLPDAPDGSDPAAGAGPPLADPADIVHPSIQDYLAFVLLDFAAADPELEEAPLALAHLLAERLGMAERFRALAQKELKLKKRTVERLAREAARMVAEASTAR